MNLIGKITAGCKAGFSIILGSCLYLVLNWIPLLGPVIAGSAAGKIAGRGIKMGFAAGLLSGAGGTILVFVILSHFNMLNILTLFVLGIWNLIGILFAGAGGAFASMISAHSRRFSYSDNSRKRSGDVKNASNEVYIVCSRCGTSNPTDRKECAECGNSLY